MSLIVDIRKSFPTFKLDVSFEAGNETLGFLGASGCGKSLTLRCIAGLEKPDEGCIIVAGTTFFDSEQGINLTPQQRKTALLFQNYMLFPNLTVADNIAAGIPRSTPKDEVHVLIKEQLKRFGIEGFGKRYPLRLSGGQQQRVALARMLAANPAILMLDEPFSALDSHLKASLEIDLLDLFDTFDGTIVYVSHDIDEAFRFCDRIAVIDRGKLVELERTQQILDHPSTYATLKVSGVKNISQARKVSDHEVDALDWGITLTCEQEVPEDVRYIGIRASFISPDDSQVAQRINIFDCKVQRTVDSRFERTILLQASGEATEPIQWRFNKTAFGACANLQRGETARIHIPDSRIHLISSPNAGRVHTSRG
jgi:molybdate transport system ATP-binding protein